MHRRRINILCEILVTCAGAFRSHAATSLLLEVGERSTLDIAEVADGDDDRVVGIEVLCIELVLVRDDFRTAVIAIFLLYLLQLCLHHFFTTLRVVQNLLQVLDGLHKFLKFLVQLIETQTRQLGQTHIDNCLGLQFVETETLLKVLLCLGRCLAGTDKMNYLVNIVAGLYQSLQDMCTLLRLLQVELGTADGDVMTMLNEVLDALTQAQQAWTPAHQCDAVHGERTLQRRHLEELVEDDIRIGITLHVDDNPHPLAARFIVYIRDTLDFSFLYQIGNVFNKLLLVDSIRNLCNNNLVVVLIALNLSLGTHHDTSAPRLIGILDSLQTVYVCPCREVGSRNELHQSVCRNIRIVDIGTAAVNHLAEIMRRDIRRHAHGNAVTAVYQQIGNLRRHHGRLAQRIVEVVDHVHRILLDIVHDVLTHL